jgi:hypothetical protein
MKDKKKGSVGYGRPPKEHQFPPGVSGNKRGRPPKRLTVGERIDLHLGRKITIVEGGKKRQVTTEDAIILGLIGDALERKRGAGKLILSLAHQFRGDPATKIKKELLEARDQELLKRAEERLMSGKKLGKVQIALTPAKKKTGGNGNA